MIPKFTIRNLISERNNQIKIPMGCKAMAEAVSQELQITYNRLARVCFEDPEINNYYENKGYKSLTGFDTIIIGAFNERTYYHMYIDMGCSFMMVALQFEEERNEPPIITPIYKGFAFKNKLSEQAIAAIFGHVFDHSECVVY